MVASYLIGVREGLEAALVVSILITYLVRTNRRDSIPTVWVGVFVAILLSLAFGGALTYTQFALLRTFTEQEIFGGVMSIIAVGLVTWMIFWMRATARTIKAEMEGRLEQALSHSALAVGLMAFVAVIREGLETSLFFFSTVQATGSTTEPLIGFVLGIASAAAAGYLIYRGAVRLNLSTFFSVTGYFLILVAAGVLSYGVHDLQEAGVVPGLTNVLFDVSDYVPAESWYGTLAKGIFNFSPVTTWVEGVVWVSYAVLAAWLFGRPNTAARPTVSSAR